MGDYSQFFSTKQSGGRSGQFPHVSTPILEQTYPPSTYWISHVISQCVECSKAGNPGHRFLGRQTYITDASDNPIQMQNRANLDHWRLMQYVIHKLHRIACGLYASQVGFLYNAPDGNNFSSAWSFKVMGVSGSTLTLDSSEIDPREMHIGYYRHLNPNYPNPCTMEGHGGGSGLYCVTDLNGCLQANDYVTFDPVDNDSVIAGRVNADIVSINILSPTLFNVTLDHDVAGARTCKFTEAEQGEQPEGYDFYENMCYVRICRHQHLPEAWLPIVSPHWLPCIARQVEIESGDFPANNIFPLQDNKEEDCRVAIPKAADATFCQTIRVRKRNDDESLTDITDEVLPYASKKRFAVVQTGTPTWESKLYLGTVLADGTSGDDLLDGSIAVVIDYFHEANQGFLHICQARCKWDMEELTGVWGESYGSRKWFCRWRKDDPLAQIETPAEHANYTPGRCYQPGKCPQFAENEPFNAWMQGAQFFDELHHAVNIFKAQIVPGNSSNRNWNVRRAKHPSLQLLAGIYKPEPPETYYPRTNIIGNGDYGRYVVVGNAIDWYNGAIWSLKNGTLFPDANPDMLDDMTWPTYGLYPNGVSEWSQGRHYLKHEKLTDTTDPFKMRRAYENRQSVSIWKNAFDAGPLGIFSLAGEGQGFVQRCGEAAQNLALPKADIQNRVDMLVPWGTLAFGNYVFDGTTYGCAITVMAMNNWANPERLKTIDFDTGAGTPTGTIYAVSKVGDLIKVECEPGQHWAGYSDVLAQFDDVFSWYGGGNIVELPDWLRFDNYYHPDCTVGCLQRRKAQIGDTIRFLGTGVAEIDDRPFYISKVEACAGGHCGWDAGLEREYFSVPGYFILNTSAGEDQYKPVTNVTGYNDTDTQAMTEVESTSRPDTLTEYQLWVDYTNNTVYVSQAAVDDQMTFTYDIDEDGGTEDIIETIPDDCVAGQNAYSASIPSGTSIYDMSQTPHATKVNDLIVERWTGSAWDEMTKVGGAPAKGEYKYFENGGAFLQFHYDNANDRCRVVYTVDITGGIPAKLDDPAQILIPLHYGDYDEELGWGDKRDIVWIEDENGYLEAAIGAAELVAGKTFKVTTQGRLSPYQTPTVHWASVSRDFTEIPEEDLYFERREGLVYIKQSRLDTIINA